MNHRDYSLQAFDQWRELIKLPKGLTLLDVGARDTKMKEPLEQRGFVWHAIDLFPETPEVDQGRMEVLPYAENSFDLLFVCHSLEHCEHPVEALREFKRVLKKDAYLFVITPFPCEHQILRADKDHIFVLNTMQWARLLLYTGFQEVSTMVHAALQEQDQGIVSIGRKP